MLQLENISVCVGKQLLLKNISLSLAAGQLVGLIGPNGAGKSTLLRAIAGLQTASGDITWQGQQPNWQQLGFMPQQCQVRSALTVLQTLLLGCHEQLGLRVCKQLTDKAIAMLERFQIRHLYQRQMHTLSGGQQQLVLLAQRLLRQPQLLLLDEATSALDICHQMRVCGHLQDYVRETGALVLMAVHDLTLAAQYLQTVALLQQGQLYAIGAFAEVLTPQSLSTVYGIEAEILRGKNGQLAVLPLKPIHELGERAP